MAQNASAPNQRRGQNFHALFQNWYEFPHPEHGEAWTYTSEFSYRAGERVDFHTSASAATYSLEILRDGATLESVYFVEALPGTVWNTPDDVSVKGCHWPVTHSWSLPEDLPAWLNEQERDMLLRALDEHEQHQGKAAERLGLSYNQMRGLMKKHDLRTRSRRSH